MILNLSFYGRLICRLRFLFYCSGYCILFVSCSWFNLFKESDTIDNISLSPDVLQDMDNASFQIDEVKGQVIASRINGLPEEIQITYKACFRDLDHLDNALQNSRFNIHFFEDFSKKQNRALGEKSKCAQGSSFSFLDPGSPSCLKIRTDLNGCVQWTEFYPYAPVDRSKWFVYVRAFQAESETGNSGTKYIQMALNPWLSLNKRANHLQLVDLRYHDKAIKKKNRIQLQEKDIPECQLFKRNSNDEEYKKKCEFKKFSLSESISHFIRSHHRPRLWVNTLESNIWQKFYVDEDKKTGLSICQSKSRLDACDPLGRVFDVTLEFPLHIRVNNYRDEEELLPLSRGKYSVKIHLFLQTVDGKKNIVLHRDVGHREFSIIKGDGNKLTANFLFNIPYEHYGLATFLALEVQAEEDLKFRPFQAVFRFPGSLDTVINNRTLKIDRDFPIAFDLDQHFNLSSLVDAYQLSGAWNHSKREGFRRAGWDIRLKRLRFSDILMEEGMCPSPVRQNIRYVGEVCIVDPLTNKMVSSIDLKIYRQNIHLNDGIQQADSVVSINLIEKKNQKQFKQGVPATEATTEEVRDLEKRESLFTTDTGGCVQWVDTMPYKYYDKEQYFIRKMIFIKENWGFKGERVIAVNPWQWGFAFFQDITYLGNSNIRTNTQSVQAPRLILHDFRSVYAEAIYQIDRWLGLKVLQNIIFLFKMRVHRPDPVTVGLGGSRPSAQDIRTGYYFMRLIFVKAHTEESGGSGNYVMSREEFLQQERPDNTNMGLKIGRKNSTGALENTHLEYITHFDTVVQARDSVINATALFEFDLEELIYIGSNSRILVQILPTDPQYYKYDPGTCNLDLKATHFKPIPKAYHDFVAQPFLGTFVAGDQRNWNIFRPVVHNLDPQLDMDSYSNAGSYLDVDKDTLDYFVEQGRRQTIQNPMYIHLKGAINTSQQDWTANSRHNLSTLGDILSDLEKNIREFISVKVSNEDNTVLLSDFNDKKEKLLETLNNIQRHIHDILKGGPGDLKTNNFVKGVFQITQNLSHQLALPGISNSTLKSLARAGLGDMANHITQFLGFDTQTDGSYASIEEKAPYFTDDLILSADEGQNWSDFNMRFFAKDEGLKVIDLGLEEGSVFVSDLNATVDKHNALFYKPEPKEEKSSDVSDEVELTSFESADLKIPENSDLKKHWQELSKEMNREKEIFNNFPLLATDDYWHANGKVKKMYLPHISIKDLNWLLEYGVHSGSLDQPAVLTFLHSLCGFWFEKFYTKYLEQEQLNIIFLNMLNKYEYYKSVLEFFRDNKDGNGDAKRQYSDLFNAMADREEWQVLDERQNHIAPQWLSPQMPFNQVNTEAVSDNVFERIWSLFSSSENSDPDPVVSSEDILSVIFSNGETALKNKLYLAGMAAAGGGGVSLILDDMSDEERHPLFKCISNPLNFFHLEKKVIVGETGNQYDDLTYQRGLTKNFNIQASFDYAYSANWSMSRAFSTSLGSGITFMGLKHPNLFKSIELFSFGGLSAKSDWSTSRSKSDSNRRQQSLRFANESLYLNVNQSVFNIKLKKFRYCLVVRPQNLAFEGYKDIWREEIAQNFIYQIPYIKSGLLICSEEKKETAYGEPLEIEEDYFYIYQPIPGDSGQFHRPMNARNRPYVISLRGQTEFEKFGFIVQSQVEPNREDGVEDYNPYRMMTNLYNQYPAAAEAAKEAIQKTKLWNKTGFYPGVIDIKYDNQHYFFRNPLKAEKSWMEGLGEFLHNNNPFGNIRFDDTKAVTDRAVPQ